MPTSTASTPLFRNAAVGPLAAGAQTSVDVRIDGHDLKYIRVTASQAPDPADTHELRINEATGAFIDIPSTSPVAVQVSAIPANGPHMIRRVYLTSGKNNTTFDVEGIL